MGAFLSRHHSIWGKGARSQARDDPGSAGGAAGAIFAKPATQLSLVLVSRANLAAAISPSVMPAASAAERPALAASWP